ncbi:hypothetical protein BLL69_2705 [Lacticaseibacillus paracasei]|nr:hypothetical protein BLL69_2705 [Lacticaseibacillus paracasei]
MLREAHKITAFYFLKKCSHADPANFGIKSIQFGLSGKKLNSMKKGASSFSFLNELAPF